MKDVNLLVSNGVNIQKSLEIFGDMETYNETLETFLAEVSGKLSKISQFKGTANTAQYAILVHSLKSDAKYFGFEKLAELSYQHELESKANNIYFIYDHYDELMIEANRIVTLVKQYLGQESKQQVIEDEIPIIVEDKTILVVDDSDIVRNFIQRIFNNSYVVLVANDGREAIDIVSQNGDKLLGMLLDLNMPNVDGFAVLDFFKEKELFKKIPVAIITGNDKRDIDQRVYQYPIVVMLKKPFNERSVKEVLDKIANSKQN